MAIKLDTPTGTRVKPTKDDVVLTQRVNRSRMHSFKSELIISEFEAKELQALIGYPTSEHGFYGYTVDNNGTSWKCADSCD